MSTHRVHPAVFMFLILPFGMMAGYLTVAIAFLFSRSGISVEQIAGVVALGIAPHTWKFAWAPIADTTLTRKTWYVLACIVSAIGIWATGALPIRASSVGWLTVIVVVSNVAVTFLGMAVESLMAYDTPEREKGRAAGWFQAGNLGGSGIGGGAGLWLAQHLHAPWMAGAILGGVSLLCCFALLFVDEPAATHRVASTLQSLGNVGRDLWSVARSRGGILALILCFLPIGAGAASGLWSAVAGDWRASANAVALATGVLGGIISAVGCLIGGFICDRMDRKAAYAVFGLLQAGCAVAMAYAPRTELMYVVFTSIYALIMGFTYAGFSAFVLEAMGKGAAATKYNVFASLSNTPIYYMTRIDGWAHTRWGAAGMLNTEALFGVVGLVLFVLVMAVASRWPRRAPGGPDLPLAAG